jgi:hypothetical protein
VTSGSWGRHRAADKARSTLLWVCRNGASPVRSGFSFWSVSWFDLGPFLRPDLPRPSDSARRRRQGWPQATAGGGAKRPPPSRGQALTLDGGEHDVTLALVGAATIGGNRFGLLMAPAWRSLRTSSHAADHRPQPLPSLSRLRLREGAAVPGSRDHRNRRAAAAWLQTGVRALPSAGARLRSPRRAPLRARSVLGFFGAVALSHAAGRL